MRLIIARGGNIFKYNYLLSLIQTFVQKVISKITKKKKTYKKFKKWMLFETEEASSVSIRSWLRGIELGVWGSFVLDWGRLSILKVKYILGQFFSNF